MHHACIYVKRLFRKFRHATRELQVAGVRANGVREAQWTLVEDQRELIDCLTLAGALVRDVQPLALADAALAFLAQEVTR